MSCCKIDSLHNCTPRGTLTTIRNILTYLTYPDSKINRNQEDYDSSSTNPTRPKWKRALLLLSEGHGIELPNIQLLADTLSQSLHCPVIAPNLYSDTPYPLTKPENWDGDKELEQFLLRHHPGTVDPILRTILDWIRSPTSQSGFGGVECLGGIGYCFGGRYVIRLMAEGEVDVGVVNHPSFFTIEEVRGLEKVRPGDVDPRVVSRRRAWSPLAIFAAEEDDIFPERKRRETEDALKSIGATWSCTTFSQTEHGFSVRGDLSNKAVRFARQAALQGAVAWFEEYLGSTHGSSEKC